MNWPLAQECLINASVWNVEVVFVFSNKARVVSLPII